MRHRGTRRPFLSPGNADDGVDAQQDEGERRLEQEGPSREEGEDDGTSALIRPRVTDRPFEGLMVSVLSDRRAGPRPCLDALPRRPRTLRLHQPPRRPPHPVGPRLLVRPYYPGRRPRRRPRRRLYGPRRPARSRRPARRAAPSGRPPLAPLGNAVTQPPGVALLTRPGVSDRGAIVVPRGLQRALDHGTIGPRIVVPSVALVPKAWSYDKATFHTGKRGVGATVELPFILG